MRPAPQSWAQGNAQNASPGSGLWTEGEGEGTGCFSWAMSLSGRPDLHTRPRHCGNKHWAVGSGSPDFSDEGASLEPAHFSTHRQLLTRPPGLCLHWQQRVAQSLGRLSSPWPCWQVRVRGPECQEPPPPSGETSPGAWPESPGPGQDFTCLNNLATEQRPQNCWQGGQEAKSPSGM